MHTMPHIMGMMDLSTLTSEIDVATGPVAKQVQVGKLKGQVIQQDGTKSPIVTLKHVTHLPSGHHNLWSISKMLQDEWAMTGDSTKIILFKNGVSIIFDIVVPTTTGHLYCLKFIRHTQEATCIGIKHPNCRVDLDVLHARLFHMHMAAVKHLAAALDLELTNKTIKICEACARAKAQRKTFSKPEEQTPQQNLELGERCIYLDIAQLKCPTRASRMTKSY